MDKQYLSSVQLNSHMSAGPGQLQRLIMDRLTKKSPNFQRVLLWELAFFRNAIVRNATRWGSIERGEISKSFVENFRRALKSLSESKRIVVFKEKFTDIFDMLDFLPYLSLRLEFHSLSKELLPDMKNFILEKKPSALKKIDYELYRTTRKTTDLKELRETWREVERKLTRVLTDLDCRQYDTWLNILLRGRYLFSGRKEEFKIPLFVLKQRLESGKHPISSEEADILNALEKLLEKLSSNIDWKIGKLKSVLYAFFSASRDSGCYLSEEIKNYLFQKHKNLLESLPGHKDNRSEGFVPMGLRGIKFSPILNQLLNRHILRDQLKVRIA